MKKLFYISSTDFVQVDMGFLHLLSNFYDVSYNIITPPKNSNFDTHEIAAYCLKYKIKFKLFYFKYRLRDPRIGIDFYNILRDVGKSKPDIIYTVSHDNPIMSMMSLSLDKTKTIVSLHDVKFHSGISFAYLYRFARWVTTSHFKYFQVFSKNQELLFKLLYPDKIVYNIPLTLSDFGEADGNNIYNKKDITRFLFFGNIMPYKGLKNLIHAFNNLSDKYSNIELTIAGRCDAWAEVYEPLIKNKHLVVQKIGFILNKEIPNLFVNAHFLVLPYNDATQSGPLMIAYNYNLPVLASNIDAFKEAVEEDKSGYLFDTRDVKDLEIKMETAILCNNEEYRLLLKRLKIYAQKHFSAEVISEKYNVMFTDLMYSKSLK
jgi:glycosyltransferase involved in cell wall biosynthesis